MSIDWQIQNAGEQSVIVYADCSDLDKANAAISQLHRQLVDSTLPITSMVPSYQSLLVSYDSDVMPYLDLRARIKALLPAEALEDKGGRRLTVPVCYGAGDVCDLDAVAKSTGIAVDEVIALHSETEYRVYAIGFAPGFAYMGSLDTRLQLPRMSTPRTAVPAGSLAIAESQTAIYPQASPGGWHILGQCAAPVFTLQPSHQTIWKVGDRVRFEPVAQSELAHVGISIDE
ncbi:5-oxoprolinase subunit PxpB [Aestuariibacter salexigens]|uniref:5-oxoprolinase subunit PxpB n=1 Tax=Aestuariibacter salexigens TaxID=226010 RepID=UPI0004145288|nr:5-oxoprolinase subunit PxpB [Aestuariibacter salexigens]